VIVHLDTSVLVDALTGPRRSLDRLIALAGDGHRFGVSAIALYEFLRGPRARAELLAQEQLFPRDATVPFGPAEAALAADLYRQVRRPRGREVDLAVAACALAGEATLWTLNRADFEDVPRLRLVQDRERLA
jgi:predicted nucleic acid-binding protein